MPDLEAPILVGGLSFLAASIVAVSLIPFDFFYSPYERSSSGKTSVNMTVNEIGIAGDALDRLNAINKNESKYTYENISNQGLKEFKNAVGLESGSNTIPHITEADNLGDDVMQSTNDFIDKLNAAQKQAEIKNKNIMPKEETKADRFMKAFTEAPEKIIGDKQVNQKLFKETASDSEMNEIN